MVEQQNHIACTATFLTVSCRCGCRALRGSQPDVRQPTLCSSLSLQNLTVPFTSLRDLPHAKTYTPPSHETGTHVIPHTHQPTGEGCGQIPVCCWTSSPQGGRLPLSQQGGQVFLEYMSAFLLRAQRYACYVMDRTAVWTYITSTQAESLGTIFNSNSNRLLVLSHITKSL